MNIMMTTMEDIANSGKNAFLTFFKGDIAQNKATPHKLL
jgi:hypothetical protein